MAYLVPFSDLWVEFTTYSWANLAVQIGGNLGVLLGFGALAPLRFGFFTSIGRIFLCGAAISLSLEILQHIVATGRVFSADDVLVNAIGAALGAALTRRWWAPKAVAAVRAEPRASA
jgi:glycopeptide antibiotics resistance protein